MSRRYFQVLLHVFACIAFLVFGILLTPGPEFSLSKFNSLDFRQDVITYILIIGFFYLNYYLLIPRFYFAKKYVKYFLLCILCFAGLIVVPRTVYLSKRGFTVMRNASHPGKCHHPDNDLHSGPPPDGNHFPDDMRRLPPPPRFRNDVPDFMGPDFHHLFFEMSQTFSLFLLMILFPLIVQIRNQLRRTEQEKSNAELSYLKAQINPHFLFNTLNSIYSLAIEKSDYTPTAVVKLSGMMRYVITETAADFVSLEKELNYVNDFVDLQKIRLGETTEVKFNISGDHSGKRIAPLILIAFIENAFKYGVNPEEKSLIVVDIKVEGKILFLLVKNKKVNSNSDLSNRVGLENTINRLDLLYSSNYELKFNDFPEEYSVELKLELI